MYIVGCYASPLNRFNFAKHLLHIGALKDTMYVPAVLQLCLHRM